MTTHKKTSETSSFQRWQETRETSSIEQSMLSNQSCLVFYHNHPVHEASPSSIILKIPEKTLLCWPVGLLSGDLGRWKFYAWGILFQRSHAHEPIYGIMPQSSTDWWSCATNPQSFNVHTSCLMKLEHKIFFCENNLSLYILCLQRFNEVREEKLWWIRKKKIILGAPSYKEEREMPNCNEKKMRMPSTGGD